MVTTGKLAIYALVTIPVQLAFDALDFRTTFLCAFATTTWSLARWVCR